MDAGQDDLGGGAAVSDPGKKQSEINLSNNMETEKSKVLVLFYHTKKAGLVLFHNPGANEKATSRIILFMLLTINVIYGWGWGFGLGFVFGLGVYTYGSFEDVRGFR